MDLTGTDLSLYLTRRRSSILALMALMVLKGRWLWCRPDEARIGARS